MQTIIVACYCAKSEEKSLLVRASKCYEMMHEDFRKLELRNQIHQKTSKDLDKQQREYFLNQQIRTIQEELGGGPESDVEDLLKKAKTKKWSQEVEDHFQKEIGRLQRQNPNSPDYNVQRNYLDFFTDLPWENYSKDVFDIAKAEKILDKAHFGLEDIKKRILEHMAVLKLKNNMKGALMSVSDKLLLRKRAIIETINDELKNIAQVEHSRHRCFDNFIVNILGALAAYCCFPKKPCINVNRTFDTQLSLF